MDHKEDDTYFRTIDTFTSRDGIDWLEWRLQFLTVARHNKWTSEEQVHYILHAIKGGAAEKTKGIQPNQFQTGHALLYEIEKCFLPSPASRSAKQLVFNQQQRPGESCQRWHNRLLALFRWAFPTAYVDGHQPLRNCFIEGLEDINIKELVRNNAKSSFHQALKAANKGEQDRQQKKNIR